MPSLRRKKPEPPKEPELRIPPMQLRIGDRFAATERGEVLDRRALVGLVPDRPALVFPGPEALLMQMVATDLRPRAKSLQRISEQFLVGGRASSKYDLELHRVARHQIATYSARRACTRAADGTTRCSRRQSAAADRLTGFLSGDWLVGHGGAPRMALPVHAQRVAPTIGDSAGGRTAESTSP